MPCLRSEFVEQSRVSRRPVGGDLTRDCLGEYQWVLKEPPCSLSIAFGRDVDVDDLAKLVDRAVDVAPPASDLDVGLVGEPAVPDRVAGRRAASASSGVNSCTQP
jgi:hypothetical protein